MFSIFSGEYVHMKPEDGEVKVITGYNTTDPEGFGTLN